jgi:serine/threonine protein kinase
MSQASGSRSFVRSLAITRLTMRKHLWIWPVVAAVAVAGFGWWVRDVVENGTKREMAANLVTILNADVAALEIWLKNEKTHVLSIADDTHVRALVARLVELASLPDTTEATLLRAPELVELRENLDPWLNAEGYQDFLVLAADGMVVAGKGDEWVGKSPPADKLTEFQPVFEGRPVVSRPAKSLILLPDAEGELKAGVPTMFAAAPVRGPDDEVIAALSLRIRPEEEFTEILHVAQAGESGETYAFDSDGLLLSQSRFDDQLKQIGLLPDDGQTRSILNLQIRDPEVDMTAGNRPAKRRSEQNLTRMAADAAAGNPGVDVDGYRDYRGVEVVGAWKWLPEYGFGVATEVDVAEAYQTLYFLRTAFGLLFALVVAASGGMFVFTLIAARMEREARKAALQAKQLGQYALDEEIGRGGMGIVCRAHHAMLRRPTAVKLLDVEKTTDDAIARFEREVRLTSQLNHPNTIAIYDYGRTPEGIFYYAMEYLDGITLEDLVIRYGPQPEGRVIHILRQICGSLGEAHGIGLIHRDVKPANVILNRRGGECDVAKLLDFGLVKAVDAQREARLTAAGAMTGTPMYMAPEAVQRAEEVDARSDLYAVGAVGYFLLTGTPMFGGDSVIEICMHQVNTPPERPADRLGKNVSPDFEALLLECLAKNPAERPETAEELIDALDRCRSAAAWTRADAAAWWKKYAPGQAPSTSKSPTPGGRGVDETIIHDSRPPQGP